MKKVKGTKGMTEYNVEQEKKKLSKRFINFDPKVKPMDHECALLGALGYSTAYIMERTRLHACQVQYRLGMAGISRLDIRNGRSIFSKVHEQAVRKTMASALVEHLRKNLAL